LLGLGIPATAQGQQHFPDTDDLQVMLRYLVEDQETPAIVLVLREADGSTRILLQGDAGPEARPLDARSNFEMGSVTKTFTGTLLADMVSRGEVSLDDPVALYVPDSVRVPAYEDREITLLDLTTHTSGLPRVPDNLGRGDSADPYGAYSVGDLYAFLSSHELRRRPGTEAEYSNLAVGLLGHVLARAVGRPYTQLVAERILEPLGMTNSGFELEGEVGRWMTRGHRAGNPVPAWYSTEAIAGAGALRSNALDMLEYLEANLGEPGSDLERAMRSAHQVRRPFRSEQGISVGLGWRTVEVGERSIVEHGGGTGGFSTHVAFDPALGVGYVMLTNTYNFADDLARDFLIGGPPLDLPEVDVAPELLRPLAGEYLLDSGPVLYVRLEPEGYLTVQSPNHVRYRLYADSDSSFFAKRSPWRLTFRTSSEGGGGLTADLEGRIHQGARVGEGAPPPAVVARNAGLGFMIDEWLHSLALRTALWGPANWAVLLVAVLGGVAGLVITAVRVLRRRSGKGARVAA
jgi:CubicO group peptidase (beta-lactamase class C family)